MHFQQVRVPVDLLIQRIRSGQLALPDFQRDFVWTPSQIAELLDTVARQWPMGSLLLMRGNKIFQAREIDGAPKLGNSKPDYYLLDGQQRVTSLFHAVTNTSRYCYYIDFSAIGDDNGEMVRWMSRTSFEKSFGDLKTRAQRSIALVSDIWESKSFYEWLNHVRSNDTRMQYLLTRDEKLAGFQANVYQVMAIELEEGIGLEAFARIFETINRTGVALNAFDLLVAKLYPSNFMIRDRWEDALRKKPALRHFEPNELEIVKLVSLLIRKDYGPSASKGVRQGDILGLKATHIIEKWDEAIDLYVKALHRLMRYGVVSKELVPNWSMVLGLAGCEIWLDEEKTFRWWRESILKQTFSQSANTKIVSEFDSALQAKPTPEDEYTKAEELLRQNVRSNGLLAKGFCSLMIKSGARDPIDGSLLSASSSVIMKTANEDGVLFNIQADNTLKDIILISGDTEVKLSGVSLIDEPYWRPSLMSQGIDLVTGNRSAQFVRDIFGEGIVK